MADPPPFGSGRFKSCMMLILLTFTLIPAIFSAAVPGTSTTTLGDDISTSQDDTSLRQEKGLYEPLLPHVSVSEDSAQDSDPYQWELVCKSKADSDGFVALTIACQTQYRFKCDGDGKLSSRKDNQECKDACECFEWSEDEGKPPIIDKPPTAGEEDSKHQVLEDRHIFAAGDVDVDSQVLEVRHDYAVGCFIGGIENTYLGRWCISSPYKYNCIGNVMASAKKQETCTQYCRCTNLNPKPKVINWAVDQVPASGTWNKRISPDVSEPDSQMLEARHDWAVSCVGSDKKENTSLGRFCISLPYKYNCVEGVMIAAKAQKACTDFCSCKNMNPRPKVINWAVDQVPGSGTWNKRIAPDVSEAQHMREAQYDQVSVSTHEVEFQIDSTQTNDAPTGGSDMPAEEASAKKRATAESESETVQPGAETDAIFIDSSNVIVEQPSAKKTLHDWGPVCSLKEKDGTIKHDKQFTVYCASAPFNYSCDHRGALVSRGINQFCEDGCTCKNFNPKPKVYLWAVDQVPKSGTWAKQHKQLSSVSTLDSISAPASVDTEPSEATDSSPETVASDNTEEVQLDESDPQLETRSLEQRHEYQLVCYDIEKKNIRGDWTQICKDKPNGYTCSSEAVLSLAKQYDQCDKRCQCDVVDPKPRIINWGPAQVPKSGSWTKRSLDKRHRFGMMCRGSDKKLNHDLTAICGDERVYGWGYKCDEKGEMSFVKKKNGCSENCGCAEINPRPGILNWVSEKVPHKGSWDKRDLGEDDELEVLEESLDSVSPASNYQRDLTVEGAQDASVVNDKSLVEKLTADDPAPTIHHEPMGFVFYVLLCFKDGKADHHQTNSCEADPWEYWCDFDGNKTKHEFREDCQTNCYCVPENVRPQVLNWPIDKIPFPGHWKRVEGMNDVLTLESEPDTELTHKDDETSNDLIHDDILRRSPLHDWNLICHPKDDSGKDWTEVCGKAPRNYACTDAGDMVYDQHLSDCNRLCGCSNTDLEPGSSIPGMDPDRQMPPEIRAVDASIDNISRRGPLHDWAMICHPNDQPSKEWTELCRKEPRKYECTEAGKLQYAKQYSECDRLCECSSANPRPVLRGGVIPISGPGPIVGAQQPVEVAKLEPRSGWLLKCEHDDGSEDIDLTHECIQSHSVACGNDGKIFPMVMLGSAVGKCMKLCHCQYYLGV